MSDSRLNCQYKIITVEFFHDRAHEASDLLERECSNALQHVIMVAACPLWLAEVKTKSSRRDDVQSIVVEIFGNATDGGCNKSKRKFNEFN
jgi:hypothetical protein